MTITEIDDHLHGWGDIAEVTSRHATLGNASDIWSLGEDRPKASTVARGSGRSYGDAAQNSRGVTISLARNGTIGPIDTRSETVSVSAEVTLGELTRELATRGWFLPVVPGTRHVQVGGAIASDVHGKNHRHAGSFGRHTRRISLSTSSGSLISLTPSDPGFWATVGGMGLTGVIVDAVLDVVPLATTWMRRRNEPAESLRELLNLIEARSHAHDHVAAWVDLSAPHRAGRGVVTSGDHLDLGDLPARLRRQPLRPWSNQCLRVPKLPVRAAPWTALDVISNLQFRSASASHRETAIVPLPAVLWPLDRLGRWHRVFCPHGLVQYQVAIPLGDERALRRLVDTLAEFPVLLATLKRLGRGDAAPLSFPIDGWTIAVDLPADAPGLTAVLNRLDAEVIGAGGRIYLAKDSRATAATIEQMYPRLDEWRTSRKALDPINLVRSDLGDRLGLVHP